MKVKVVWLNGDKETIHCRVFCVRDGLLVLEIKRDEWQYIPFTSIRAWTAVES